LTERAKYNLARDFPILRSRLAVLLQHLAQTKPRTWRELWQDKRDSSAWLTFWAVIIIGAAGLVLGLLQVVLQAVQVFKG
jgi:type VI protein secretion system component VasF